MPKTIAWQGNCVENELALFEARWQWQVYVRDCTMVTPYPLLLFGGEIVVKHELMTICMDDWIEFRSPGKVAVLIKQLRAVSRPHTCTSRETPLHALDLGSLISCPRPTGTRVVDTMVLSLISTSLSLSLSVSLSLCCTIHGGGYRRWTSCW